MEFNYVVNPQLTKEFILSNVSQESIFNYYLGHIVTTKKLFISPFRVDNHTTCGYYKSNNGTVYLHDFATNDHINCFQAVMKLYSLTYYQALRKIAIDFKLLENSKIEYKKIEFQPELQKTESANIQVKIKNFTEEELKWWKSFGISDKLLKKFNVYSIEHVFLDGELKFSSSFKNPIYGYYFGKDKNGKEQWKIYFPTRDQFRFLGNLRKKTLQGYHQLPEKGELLVITKSMKDVISLRGFGIYSVSPNSETLFLSDKQLNEFKSRFHYILVLYDNDRTGKYNLSKIRKIYPELNYYVLPKTLAKDFTDAIKKIGMVKMRELLIKFLINYKFK